MRRSRGFHNAVLLIFLIVLPSSSWALDVPLTIHNDLDQARNGEMLTVGVPFPPGALNSVDQLSVLDATGTPVGPVQARAMSTWWDDRPRWVLFDFPVDVGAGAITSYTVTTNGTPQTSSPLSVSETPASIQIETGVLQLVIGKSSFRVIEEASIDADGNGSYETLVVSPGASKGIVVVGTDGTEYVSSAGAPDVITVEESGPSRVTVLVRGWVRPAGGGGGLLRHHTRISAFANSGRVRVQHTLHNPNMGSLSLLGSGSVEFRDARIELSTPFASGSAVMGGEEGVAESFSTPLSGGARAYLYQDSSGMDTWNKHAGKGLPHKAVSFRGFRAMIDDGSASEMGSGDHAAGWLDLRGAAAGVTVGIREFWQNFPNAVEADGSGRVLARYFADQFAGDHSLRGGEQKTHTIEFFFHGSGMSATDAAARVSAQMSPLLALATPDWYNASRCFRPFLPKARSPYADYEFLQEATVYGRGNRSEFTLESNHEIDDVYGWMDYGDNHAEYEQSGDRSNLENDFSFGMILQMVRSGEPIWWRFASPGARHVADIAVYHTTEDEKGWKNGGFFEHDRTGSNRHRGDVPQPNHYNSHGMITYYYMSGDPVTRDAFLEMAENVNYRVNEPNGFSYVGHEEHRSAAWLFDNQAEAWKLTKDTRFRDNCLFIIDRTHVDTKCYQDGGTCLPEEIWHNKNYVTIWHVGILMTFIGQFQEERFLETGAKDARAMSHLQGWADFINTYMWLPAEQTFGKGYNWKEDRTSITFLDSGPINGIRICDGLATAYKHLGDPNVLQYAEAAFLTSTAHPWFPGSPITYADVKVQATAARNGHVYMSLRDEDLPPPCLSVQTTAPTSGGELAADAPISLLFGRAVDRGSLESRLTVEGNETGAFTTDVSWVNDFLVSVSLSPAPASQENITLRLADGVRDSEGVLLDGDGDRECGGAYVLTVVAEEGQGEPDTTAPAGVQDLLMSFDSGTGAATIAWTAPFDDGPVGKPSQLYVRYSTSPVAQGFDWNTAQPFMAVPSPANPGQTQQIHLGYINASTGTLQVAMRSEDAAGNVSIMSNVARDNVGPRAYSEGGTGLTLHEGGSAVVRVFVVDSSVGNGRVNDVRFYVDQEDPAAAPVLSLEPVDGFARNVGTIDYLIDAGSWPADETHVLFFQGRDDAGNWSEEAGWVQLDVVAAVDPGTCLQVSQALPAASSVVASVSSVIFNFDQALDLSTVTPENFTSSFTPEGGSARALDVDINVLSSAALRINLGETISEVGQLIVLPSARVLSADGQPLGQGINCDAPSPLIVDIDPGVGAGDCMSIVQILPLPQTELQTLTNVTLTFDQTVDSATVDEFSVSAQLTRAGGSQAMDTTFEWLSPSILRVHLSPAVSEAGEVVLSLNPAIQSEAGAPLGEGDNCDALGTIRFFVQREPSGEFAGTELGELARDGQMSVNGYQVIFSELEPGDTLRVYDTSGFLLHQARIDDDSYTLDTSTLGSFPIKQFIVKYRDGKQHIITGRNVDFYRSYIGELE